MMLPVNAAPLKFATKLPDVASTVSKADGPGALFDSVSIQK